MVHVSLKINVIGLENLFTIGWVLCELSHSEQLFLDEKGQGPLHLFVCAGRMLHFLKSTFRRLNIGFFFKHSLCFSSSLAPVSSSFLLMSLLLLTFIFFLFFGRNSRRFCRTDKLIQCNETRPEKVQIVACGI